MLIFSGIRHKFCKNLVKFVSNYKIKDISEIYIEWAITKCPAIASRIFRGLINWWLKSVSNIYGHPVDLIEILETQLHYESGLWLCNYVIMTVVCNYRNQKVLHKYNTIKDAQITEKVKRAKPEGWPLVELRFIN